MALKFREGQKQVMEYQGGWMAVPSVPGAGKTFTLTQLAARIIRENRHLPGKVLIVTYMNSAVANFKQRISDHLKKAELNPSHGYEVMTLHSLAMKILKEKPDGIWISDEFSVLDELKQIGIIKDVAGQWIGRNQEDFDSLLDIGEGDYRRVQRKADQWRKKFNTMVSHMISYFKSMGYDENFLSGLTRELPKDSPLRWCVEIYDEYQRILRSRGQLDFDDILHGALSLLKQNPDLLEKYQQKYTYIFEDEAQDSTPIQQEVLMMLSARHGNLLRVGDSNQSIMSTFTVSDPKLFRQFSQHPQTQVQSILMASRSCCHVIDLANYLVEWVRGYHPVPECKSSLEEQLIKPVGEEDPFPNPVTPGYSVACREFKKLTDELNFVAHHAARFIAQYPDKTAAVLAPTGYRLESLRKILESEGVPYREITRFPKERAYTSSVLGALLDYLAFPYDNRRLVTALRLLLPFDPGQGEGLFQFLGSSRFHLEEMFYPLTGTFDESIVPRELVDSGEWQVWKEWKDFFGELLEMSGEMPEYLILHIAEKLAFDKEQMAIAQKIASDVRYLMAMNPRWSLTDLAQELKDIQSSFNYFANVVYDMQGYEAQPGEVTLITYHKAKGLEWDTVFLTSITAGDFPSLLTDPFMSDYSFLKEEFKNPTAVVKNHLSRLNGETAGQDPVVQARVDTISERLRLLYVGITRARENLVLTAHHLSDTDMGFSIPTKPSLYFNILMELSQRQGGLK